MWQILGYGLLTAVATGLGALPFLFTKRPGKVWIAKANAVAAALMIAASFGLVNEGLQLDLGNLSEVVMGISRTTWMTTLGMLGGLLFVVIADKILGKYENLHIGDLSGADSKKVLLIVGIMTIHSFAEGIAIGVSFAPSVAFGIFIALALALHNIPEGLAISTVMTSKGFPWWKAALWSIFSSLPQPLMALPAFFFVEQFTPFLPLGLGFAAGAMLWMAISELLPDAFEDAPSTTVATIATIGIVIMILFQAFLG